MAALVECEGAPRDLGRDQAAAATRAIRAAVAAGSTLSRLRDRFGIGDAHTMRWRRDARRYFPHQHEWLEGVARGAGVPDRALWRAAIAELERERDALLVGAEGVALWRSEPDGAQLRRVRPEGRFVSIELASPLLASPWIGINEAGLAVATSGGARPGACRAHAALLARDCLERFEAVESALAWCLGRPAAPGAAILLADSAGELAGVELSAPGRRVRRPEAGILVLGGRRVAELGKQLSGVPLELSALDAALARVLGDAPPRVDLSARSLRAAGVEAAGSG